MSEIIYLNHDDDIYEATQRISKAEGSELVLYVPPRSLILQNVLNLKIVKHIADGQNKTLKLSTADPLGLAYAAEAGLAVESEPVELPVSNLSVSVYQQEEDVETLASEELYPEDYPEEDEDEDADVEEEDFPLDSAPSKFAWVSNLKFDKIKNVFRKPQKFDISQYKPQLETHHKQSLTLVGIAVLILVAIGIFVIPKATVALEVPAEAFSKQFRLVLADEKDVQAVGQNIVPGRFIEVVDEHVASFTSTGEENKGSKASGQINVINHTAAIQGLLAGTRFQAPNGAIFKTNHEVLVPPARGKTPGKAIVEATSDAGGTKYNVKAPTKLTIPGLGEIGKDTVYGEVFGTFSGGTDDIVRVVSEADIDKAKEEASKNIFVSAESQLQKLTKGKEELNPLFIQNDIIDAIPSVTPGAKQEKFEIRVQSRSWTIVTKKDFFKHSLGNAAGGQTPEGKQLTQQTLDSAKVEAIDGDFLTHRVNLLVTLEGKVGPRLDPKEISKDLSNKNLAEAQAYLKNQPGIASSNIVPWPSFLPRLPYLVNNIRVQITYLGE